MVEDYNRDTPRASGNQTESKEKENPKLLKRLTLRNCAWLQRHKKAWRPFGKCTGLCLQGLGVNPGCSIPHM